MVRIAQPLAVVALALAAATASAETAGDAGLRKLALLLQHERGQLDRLAARFPAARPGPADPDPEELACLAKAIYFEARGEPRAGQQAVAEVVLNRRDREDYPDTVCGVVHDRRFGGCQFSWVCTRDDHSPRDLARFREIRDLAHRVITGRTEEIADGATHFHNTRVSPGWGRVYRRTGVIGGHVFYRARRP